MRPSDRYTYEDAGFNGLMNRSRKSVSTARNIQGASRGSGRALNFDLQQVEGSLGDKLRVGHIVLKGADSQIAIENEGGVETTWIGRLVSTDG